ILAASSLSCIKNKTWSPYDKIMISLSSSRLTLHSWTTMDFFVSIFYKPFYYKENTYMVSKIIFAFLSYSSLWFGAWLSLFYCIKVASFTQSFFIWMKQRIARLMPWMLLTSWLCSVTAAIPFAWDVYRVHNNFTAPSTITNSSARRTTTKETLPVLILCNATIIMPLIL
ncbi:T2R40 protein, partial [Pycnonotus jocosus]|nr:T2R40 protein [Pycnonotus jocosus]